jgi:hypothetical protein
MRKVSLIPIVISLAMLVSCTYSASTPPPARQITEAPTTYLPTQSIEPTSLPQDGALKPDFSSDVERVPDATRYTISLDVNPAGAEVNGSETVVYTNRAEQSLSELYLRLFPNTPAFGGKMSVYDLTVAGQTITPIPESDGSALRLPLSTPLAPGKDITLSMNFSVIVPTNDQSGYAELSLVDGVMSLSNIYPFIPVYDTKWHVSVAPEYGDVLYGQSAFFTVHINAPANETVVASGSCQRPKPGNYNCIAGPMRDFFVVVSDRYSMVSQTVDGTQINSYYYSGEDSQGQKALRFAVQSFEYFTRQFGPYPYQSFNVVETPTRAGGVEYPGVVSIAGRLYGQQEFEWVIAHEVAHQWWYGVVGDDQLNTPWMDESLAQYSTYLYFQNQYGSTVANRLKDNLFVQPYNEAKSAGNDMPIGLSVAAYKNTGEYVDIVYDKGPLYFDTLAGVIGQDVMIKVLQQYYASNRYGVATPNSWLAAVKAVTGDEHLDLFNQWVLGEGATPAPTP